MEESVPEFIKKVTFDDESSVTAYKLYKKLSKISNFTHGNKVDVFYSGNDYYESLCQHVDAAKKRVWLEMYIFDGSSSARKFVDHLIDASKRGCDVVMVLDYVGSLEFPKAWKKELQDQGVKVYFFNPILPPGSSNYFFTFRNHRKILITDNTAFCGSGNIAFRSTSKLVEGKVIFHEFGVKVRGPIVAELGKSFLSILEIAHVPITRKPFETTETFDDGSPIQILESNPKTCNKTIQQAFQQVLDNANKEICIATSYFHPCGIMRRALEDAKERRVPTTILLSGKSDIHCDVQSTKYLINKLLLHPPSNDLFKIFFTKKWHFHGKILTVDNLWTSIGTFNMDRISSRRNLEISLGILDHRIAKQVKEMQQYFSSPDYAEEYTLEISQALPFYNKLYYKMCHIGRKYITSTKWLDWFIDEGFKYKFRHTFIRTFIEDNAGRMLASASNIIGM